MKFKNKLRFLPLLITPVVALPTTALTSCKVSFSDVEKTIKGWVDKLNNKFKNTTVEAISVFTDKGLNNIKDILSGKISPNQIQNIITNIGSLVLDVPISVGEYINSSEFKETIEGFYKNIIDNINNFKNPTESDVSKIINKEWGKVLENINKASVKDINQVINDYIVNLFTPDSDNYKGEEIANQLGNTLKHIDGFGKFDNQSHPNYSDGFYGFPIVDDKDEDFYKLDIPKNSLHKIVGTKTENMSTLVGTTKEKYFLQTFGLLGVVVRSYTFTEGYYISYTDLFETTPTDKNGVITMYNIEPKQNQTLSIYNLNVEIISGDRNLTIKRGNVYKINNAKIPLIPMELYTQRYINDLNKN